MVAGIEAGLTAREVVSVSAFGYVYSGSPPHMYLVMDETIDLHPQDNEQHNYVLVTGANR